MESDCERVEAIISKYNGRRDSLISMLQDIQSEYHYLPENAMRQVADRTGIALIRLADVVNSNHGLVLEKDMKKPIEICTCPNCLLNGGAELLSGLREILLVKSCSKGIGARYYISTVIAPGSPCTKPPTVIVNGQRYHNITLSKLLELIDAEVSKSRKCKPHVKSAT
jgi:NADH-quinone oxidoreductase subunit E